MKVILPNPAAKCYRKFEKDQRNLWTEGGCPCKTGGNSGILEREIRKERIILC
jgi:hypothetical protein